MEYGIKIRIRTKLLRLRTEGSMRLREIKFKFMRLMCLIPSTQLMLKHSRIIHLVNFFLALQHAELFIHTASRCFFSRHSSKCIASPCLNITKNSLCHLCACISSVTRILKNGIHCCNKCQLILRPMNRSINVGFGFFYFAVTVMVYSDIQNKPV